MNQCQFYCRSIKRQCNSGIKLPDGFTSVNYIESSGAQYLNIGAGKNHQYYLADFMQLYGVASSASAVQYNINGLFGINGYSPYPSGSTKDECKTWLRYTTPYTILGILNNVVIGETAISLNTRYEYYLSVTSATLNGADFTTNATGTITSAYDSYIFKVNNAGDSVFASAVRLFHLQTSSIDLYPCIRNSDNKAGMFDIINNNFYYNQGTGSFITG